MENLIIKVQIALNQRGFNCGKADNVMGPKTENAIMAFKKSIGYKARPYLGPLTLKALGISQKVTIYNSMVPYLNEMSKYMGVHEEEAQLKAWLEEDPNYNNDPDNVPWCASAITVCIKNTMPNEPLIGRLAENTSLALNWLDFGKECKLAYGAICVLWRNNPDSWMGHIAIAIGYDPESDEILMRGGNQGDKVCDRWFEANRVRDEGFRMPITFKGKLPPIPIMNANGAIISTNET